MPAHQLLCITAVAAITPRPRVAVVGAGVSGLNCARKLQPTCDVTVFEASDGVGGRVRSDREHGYVFDRGFAVFLEAYEESREALDYDALRLRPFQPGALVCQDGERQFVGDPLRRPQDLLPSLRAPVGTLGDKLRAGLLRTGCLALDSHVTAAISACHCQCAWQLQPPKPGVSSHTNFFFSVLCSRAVPSCLLRRALFSRLSRGSIGGI